MFTSAIKKQQLLYEKSYSQLHYNIEDTVGNGTKIPYELIKLNPPTVTWPYKRGAKHTLAMIGKKPVLSIFSLKFNNLSSLTKFNLIVDLDNHSFEVYDVKEIFIWLVTDIPRNDVDKGRVVYSYFGDEHEPRVGNIGSQDQFDLSISFSLLANFMSK